MFACTPTKYLETWGRRNSQNWPVSQLRLSCRVITNAQDKFWRIFETKRFKTKRISKNWVSSWDSCYTFSQIFVHEKDSNLESSKSSPKLRREAENGFLISEALSFKDGIPAYYIVLNRQKPFKMKNCIGVLWSACF